MPRQSVDSNAAAFYLKPLSYLSIYNVYIFFFIGFHGFSSVFSMLAVSIGVRHLATPMCIGATF